MARSRNIKPGFYKNEDLAECSLWARFIFPGLWMLADREGRLEDRPKRIKGELLPFDAQEIEPLLNELQARGFILRYRNKDGAFIQIIKFAEHQSPHYSEKPSVIKPPLDRDFLTVESSPTPRTHPEDSEKEPAIKRGSQPPDSLIPDSLIPESLSKRFPGDGDIGAPTEAVAALSSLCAQHRVAITSKAHRMHLAQWAAEGLTPEQFALAIATARERKPDPAVIPIGYLVPIVADVRAGVVKPPQTREELFAEAAARCDAADAREAQREAEKAARRAARNGSRAPNGHEPEVAWWRDASGLQARCTELRLPPLGPEESWDEYTARVIAAGRPEPWEVELPEPVRERVEYFRATGG